MHIFEVKSLNQSTAFAIDDEQYRNKIEKLKQAYIYVSQKTEYIFYLPKMIEDKWRIWYCQEGMAREELLDKDSLIEKIKEGYL